MGRSCAAMQWGVAAQEEDKCLEESRQPLRGLRRGSSHLHGLWRGCSPLAAPCDGTAPPPLRNGASAPPAPTLPCGSEAFFSSTDDSIFFHNSGALVPHTGTFAAPLRRLCAGGEVAGGPSNDGGHVRQEGMVDREEGGEEMVDGGGGRSRGWTTRPASGGEAPHGQRSGSWPRPPRAVASEARAAGITGAWFGSVSSQSMSIKWDWMGLSPNQAKLLLNFF